MGDLDSIWAPSFSLLHVLSYTMSHMPHLKYMEEGTDAGEDHDDDEEKKVK